MSGGIIVITDSDTDSEEVGVIERHGNKRNRVTDCHSTGCQTISIRTRSERSSAKSVIHLETTPSSATSDCDNIIDLCSDGDFQDNIDDRLVNEMTTLDHHHSRGPDHRKSSHRSERHSNSSSSSITHSRSPQKHIRNKHPHYHPYALAESQTLNRHAHDGGSHKRAHSHSRKAALSLRKHGTCSKKKNFCDSWQKNGCMDKSSTNVYDSDSDCVITEVKKMVKCSHHGSCSKERSSSGKMCSNCRHCGNHHHRHHHSKSIHNHQKSQSRHHCSRTSHRSEHASKSKNMEGKNSQSRSNRSMLKDLRSSDVFDDGNFSSSGGSELQTSPDNDNLVLPSTASCLPLKPDKGNPLLSFQRSLKSSETCSKSKQSEKLGIFESLSRVMTPEPLLPRPLSASSLCNSSPPSPCPSPFRKTSIDQSQLEMVTQRLQLTVSRVRKRSVDSDSSSKKSPSKVKSSSMNSERHFLDALVSSEMDCVLTSDSPGSPVTSTERNLLDIEVHSPLNSVCEANESPSQQIDTDIGTAGRTIDSENNNDSEKPSDEGLTKIAETEQKQELNEICFQKNASNCQVRTSNESVTYEIRYNDDMVRSDTSSEMHTFLSVSPSPDSSSSIVTSEETSSHPLSNLSVSSSLVSSATERNTDIDICLSEKKSESNFVEPVSSSTGSNPSSIVPFNKNDSASVSDPFVSDSKRSFTNIFESFSPNIEEVSYVVSASADTETAGVSFNHSDNEMDQTKYPFLQGNTKISEFKSNPDTASSKNSNNLMKRDSIILSRTPSPTYIAGSRKRKIRCAKIGSQTRRNSGSSSGIAAFFLPSTSYSETDKALQAEMDVYQNSRNTSIPLPQSHTNIILGSVEEGGYFLDHGLNYFQSFNCKYKPPDNLLQEIVKGAFLCKTNLAITRRSYDVLTAIINNYPGTVVPDWKTLVNCCNSAIYNSRGGGGGGVNQDNDAESSQLQATLLLRLSVHALKQDLYRRDLKEQKEIRRSAAYRILAYDYSSKNLKSLICYLHSALIGEDCEDKYESSSHIHVHSSIQEDTNGHAKVFPLLQELLDLAVNVSSSCEDSANFLASELLRGIYSYLLTVDHKYRLLQSITSELLLFHLTQKILESRYSEIFPLCGFPDTISDIVECFFSAVPLIDLLTPPTTPNEDGKTHFSIVQHDPIASEEMAMLLYFCIKSFIMCCKKKSHVPLHRRDNHRGKMDPLCPADIPDLAQLPDSVDDLQGHLERLSLSLTPATHDYLQMTSLLSVIV